MKVIFLILGCITTTILVSCEKVIDVNLKSATPILVIEGVVTNRVDSQFVKINRSVSFGEPSVFPQVQGARVTITDGTSGRVIQLRERRPGFYMARNFTGIPGTTYRLKVETEGQVYEASSRMPSSVNIDSIGISSGTFLGEEQKTVQILYTDPGSERNYYRFVLKVNGKPSKNIFTFDDNFNNGKSVTRDLFDFDLKAESGDRAEIEMQCVDPVIYRYWQGVDQNESRGGASTTPANPVSNLSNGALGYFSAHTRQNEVIVIP